MTQFQDYFTQQQSAKWQLFIQKLHQQQLNIFLVAIKFRW